MLAIFLLLPDIALAWTGARTPDRGKAYNASRADLFRAEWPEGAYRKEEVIIKFKPGFNKTTAFFRKYKLNILKSDAKLDYFLAKAPPATDLPKLLNTLGNNPNVAYIQPNYIYQPFKTYNDTQYFRQWALQKINIEKAWDVTPGKPGIVVAILDTGVDHKHPDLQGRLVAGTNTVNPLRSTRDDFGHGTHVAGIVAAAANNSTGIAGMANVRIMPVKVFNTAGGSDISIADGIIWAADHGARVINMSFGSFYRSPVLNDAIAYAREKNIVMVAAAGNWASEYISYPAALKDVIAVSATNKKDELSEFSSYGPEIDVSAPGEEIYSTYWDPYKGSTYREESGTSMAAPMVTGLAALLLSKNPRLSADDVREIIEASATDLGEPGWDPKYGHGRIDVYKALNTSFARTDSGNNSQDKAVPVNSGQIVTGKIDYGSDEDWYKVSIPAKGALQVTMEPAGLVSPAVQIFDAGGELASFNNAEKGAEEDDAGIPAAYRISFPGFDEPFIKGSSMQVAETVYGLLPDLEPGEYFIKVFGNHNRWSKESYRLTATVLADAEVLRDSFEPNDAISNAKAIALNTPVQGVVGGTDDIDLYKVNLEADRYYRLELDVPPGLDLIVEIFRDDEEDYFNEFINNGGQGKNEAGVIRTSKKGYGVYNIAVYDKAGAAVNAYYTLRLQSYTPAPDPYEDNNIWQHATPVKINDSIQASFTDGEDEDWYKIAVDTGGILEVRAGGADNVLPALALYQNPEDEPVGYDNWDYSANEDRSLEFKVNPGTYYLNAMSYGGAPNSEYTLDFAMQNFNFVDNEDNDLPLKANTLTVGAVKQGTLYPDGDVDFYVLDIEKPEPVLVYLAPAKEINGSVIVFREREPDDDNQGQGSGKNQKSMAEQGPGGDDANRSEPVLDVVTEIDSGKKGQIDMGVFIPNRPGRYYLAVNSWDPAVRGTYTLSLKPFKVQPDRWEDNNTFQKARPINKGTPVQPTFMGIEDMDWYKVYIPSAARLNLSMNVPGDIDGVIEIYDSSAKLLGKIDNALTGDEELAALKIDRAGWYYLKTYDYLGNASVQPYSLIVNWKEQKQTL